MVFTLKGVKQTGQAGIQGLLLWSALFPELSLAFLPSHIPGNKMALGGLIVMVYAILDIYTLITIF